MFELSEEQRQVQRLVRTFAESEIKPHVPAMERGEMLPFELFRKMARTFGIPDLVRSSWEAYRARRREGGGAGAERDGERLGALGDPALAAIVAVELARICPGFALAFGASLGLCGRSIMARGTDEQREKYGLPVLTTEKIGAWGFTEPGAGSDAFAMRSTAVPVDGGYVLNGSKTFITNCPYADVIVTYAKIVRDGAEPAIHGFILERGMKGLEMGRPLEKMGMHSSPTGEFFMSDLFVPRENLLGGEEREPARAQALSILYGEKAGTPALALGIIERCIEDSVRYAKQRVAFGQPIAEYQLIQEKIARMYVRFENVRNMMFKQIWMQKEGRRDLAAACAAKLYCAQAAVEVALDAIQIHGGNGYMREYMVEMFMRDAKLLEIGGGTNEIQTLHVARQVLREEGALQC